MEKCAQLQKAVLVGSKIHLALWASKQRSLWSSLAGESPGRGAVSQKQAPSMAKTQEQPTPTQFSVVKRAEMQKAVLLGEKTHLVLWASKR